MQNFSYSPGLGVLLWGFPSLSGSVAQGLGVLGLLLALLVSMACSRVVDRHLDRRGVFTPVIDEVREPAQVLEV